MTVTVVQSSTTITVTEEANTVTPVSNNPLSAIPLDVVTVVER